MAKDMEDLITSLKTFTKQTRKDIESAMASRLLSEPTALSNGYFPAKLDDQVELFILDALQKAYKLGMAKTDRDNFELIYSARYAMVQMAAMIRGERLEWVLPMANTVCDKLTAWLKNRGEMT